MEVKTNKVYVLNPCYHLRNDIHRIALFSKANINGNTLGDWNAFIHPLQAVMLSFFTFNRRLDNNIQLLSNLFNRDITYMSDIINSYINNNLPIYATWKGQKIYFPKNVLVDLNSIDHDYYFRHLSSDLFACKNIDLTSRRFYSGPLILTLMLNNKCVTHCTYCYADTKTNVKQPLSTSRILELILEASKLQVQQVNLIGGEIFLHPDWDIILKELVKRDIAPEYISTKIPFTDNLLKRLKNTGYNNLIQVSLDTCDDNVLQEMLGAKNTYGKKVLKGLLALDQSGLKYQVSSVFTTHNSDRQLWNDLFCFLSTLKHLENWRIVPVNMSINIKYQDFISLKPPKATIETIFNYIEESIFPLAKFPILLGREVLDNKFYTDNGGSAHFRGAVCSALNTHMFILPNGKVTICEQLYWNPRFIIGDVTYQSLIEVWNSPRSLFLSNLKQEDIQQKSYCKTCSVFDQCYSSHNRCWSNIIKAYGDLNWDYPDPRCCFAPKVDTFGY
ncbi:radical SAM/SPASM domain-containing protein [uncultured Bacteroides sp.]|uniref:radical SAM/SPASM domain-containing protein n=1 Tax=uncultured Bacteroides sp. TaxID=162156 RepID=UPI002AAA72F7|nr:radical SAM protein [uncultured Bacteroides sp.]